MAQTVKINSDTSKLLNNWQSINELYK